MSKEELYLKTVFCCMTCDGNIDPEEVNMVKDLCENYQIFKDIDVEKYINTWISDINENGSGFLLSYLRNISSVELNDDEQLLLVSLALKTIEADKVIEYSEIKFFKKIRLHLSINDDLILAKFPDKEDYLLQDINVAEEPIWDTNTSFSDITITN